MTDWNQLAKFATSPQSHEYALDRAKGKKPEEIAVTHDVNARTVTRSLARLKAKAEAQGYAPERDQVHPVPNSQNIAGVSTLYGADGQVQLQWVKSKADKTVDTSKALREFAEEICIPYKGKIKPISPPKSYKDQLLTTIVIGDPHLGMLAFSHTTGYEDFDTDIAEAELTAALLHMIEQAQPGSVLIINNKGDLFHTDGNRPFTPASGHLLDSDGRFSYTFRSAARIWKTAIAYALKKFQTVVVMNDRGNHDETTAVLFNILLQEVYSNEPRVIIPDNEVKMRFYQWGKTGIWFDHSHKAPVQRLIGQIVSKFAKEWGASEFRYGLFGHEHHDHTKKNDAGIMMEWFSTLAPPDQHHADAAYGYSPSITSITYHKEYGEAFRYKAPLKLIREIMKG